MIPDEAYELAKANGWKGFDGIRMEHQTWRRAALDPLFWEALWRGLKFDQPIWHCKMYGVMCVVDGKKTIERRCPTDYCELAGCKNLVREQDNFFHIIMRGSDTRALRAYWENILTVKEE